MLKSAEPTIPLRARPDRSFHQVWRQHWMLYVFLIPAAVALVLFHYVPLYGIAIAFLRYNPARGILGSPFVGLANFARFLGRAAGLEVLRNTLVIAVSKIIVGQVAAICFALLLNEMKGAAFRRIVQTTTTFPYFVSWVIIGGVMLQILSSSGPVNTVVKAFGAQPIRFLGRPSVFTWTLVFSDAWKGFGFSAVIYFAALTAISPDLYEAAVVDGAGRWSRMRHVTLPGIGPTVILMSCLALGGILNAGFEQVLVLYNPRVYATGDIIDTYVYRIGLLERDYGLGAAVGLFRSVIGFFLILLSYWLADRLADYRIF